MSYFNKLKTTQRIIVPPFWKDQSYFLRDGFIMGCTLEGLFIYFNAYDSFVRKSTLKGLEQVRYADYKQEERIKLNTIKQEKMEKLKKLEELAEKRAKGLI